jgi:outer membrane protein OmpA-like peptidoglycan-associated protein
MRTPRSLVLLLALVVVATAPATASAAGDVSQSDIEGSVVPLNADGAVLPIDVADSIQPLEVQNDTGPVTRVTLSSDVLFAFNKTTLTATAQQTIDRVVRRLGNRPSGRIVVDGYTDSVGSAAYNLGLSRRRASSVQRALAVALGGSRAHRIVTRGHGEADPVAPNTDNGHDNPAGRAKNRRVVISFPRG